MVRSDQTKNGVLNSILCSVALVVVGVLLWPVSQAEEFFLPIAVPTAGTLTVHEPGFFQQVHSLEGTWLFSPGLLDPDVGALTPSRVIVVPGPMKQVPATEGTYRLTVKGLVPGQFYGLFTKEIANSCRIFVNGERVGSRGRFDSDFGGYRDEVGPVTVIFRASETTEVVIQVMDRTTSVGGLWQRVYLGSSQQIVELQTRVTQRDVFFLASILMMAVFQWILALVIHRDRSTIFLALFCTAIVINSAFSETMVGFSWFPSLSFSWGMAIDYLVLTTLVPLFLSYVRYCFPEETWPPLVALAWIPSLVEAGVVLLTPFAVYQASFVWFQMAMTIGCVVVLVIGVRACWHGREGALLFVLGFCVVFATGINDLLFSNHIIQTGYWLNIGISLFLLFQAAILILRYRAALVRVEEMSRNLEGEVASRTKELAEERSAFEQLSQEDSLTGLCSKRHLHEVFDTEFEAYKRYGHAFSVLMIDLDWFRRVNETYGHPCGDQILVELAAIVRNHLRKTDLCARFGGEELVVVMRNTKVAEARLAAENLRQTISTTPFEAGEGRGLVFITISIGVVEVSEEASNEAALIKRANEALGRAKSMGRNQVVVL